MRRRYQSVTLLGRVAFASLFVLAVLGVGRHAAADEEPRIAPPNSHVQGRTYSEWAAAWWRWAVTAPTSINPVLDTTGADCAVGQSGSVWFLAGIFGPGAVTRTCRVPAGYSLFFPIVNIAYFAFSNDPPETRTEQFVRSQVTCVEGATDLHASVDGREVNDVAAFLEQSVLFEVQLPSDNVFGLTAADVPGLLLTPSVDEGFYLFVEPLSPGHHTVKFGGTSPCLGGASLDVTYNLTVVSGRQ